jgi:hypothetical protein
MTHVTETDVKLLNEFRGHYESQGMKYIINPKSDELPSFLRNSHPSALAVGGDGNGVVLQLRHIEESPARNDPVRELSKLVRNQKGWSLDVVLAEKDYPYLLPSRDQILESIADIRKELDKLREGRDSFGDAAVLLQLSSPIFEAAARRALEEKGVLNSRNLRNRKAIVESLLEQDVIDDSEASHILRILGKRDLAAHGFVVSDTSPEDVAFMLALTEKVSKTSTMAAK